MNGKWYKGCGFVLAGLVAAGVSAAPPEGKGEPHGQAVHADAGAKGKPGGHGKHAGDGKPDRRGARGMDTSDLVRAGITAATVRTLIGERGLDLGGYAALPPGIRKNLARGKPLPPGIAKRAVPAPLLADLPRYPGYEWQVVGRDLVLISLGSALVADVLQGVFD